MSIAENWEIWNEGAIKEVAKVYHEVYGYTNITYQTTPEFVAFLTDGFLLAMHFRTNRNEITKEGRDALLDEIAFHTNFLKQLRGI